MPLSRLLTTALLGGWAGLVLAVAAPTWLPSAMFVKNLLDSVLKAGNPEAGLSYVLGHHGEMLGKTLVLHLVLAGSGAAAARWLAARWRGDLLVAWGVGFGIVSLFLLGWGLAGLLFPGPVFASTGLLAASGLVLSGRGMGAGASRALREALAPGATRWLIAAGAAALVLLVGLALAPDSSWDAVVYHLRVPAFFIQEHRAFYIPTHHFTAFPLATEMHNLWLMLWGDLDRMGGGQAPKLFHLSCAVVTGICAGRMARVLLRRAPVHLARGAGLLAVVLVLVCPFTGTIAVRAYNDLVEAALPALALVVLLERSRGATVLAGALCGVALSAKYTAVMVLLPVGVLWFGLRPAPYVIAAALTAPWVLKNAVLTGNPAAPFLTGLFPSSPESQFQLTGYARSVGAMSLDLGNFLRLLTVLFRGSSGERLTELLGLLLPAALLLRGGAGALAGSPAGRLVAFTAAFAILWGILTPDLRFFAPALGGLAALAAVGFLKAEIAFGRWLRIGLGVVLALNLVRLPRAHISLFSPLPFVLGRETVWDNATRALFPAPYFGRAARAANGALPARARLLVMIDIKAHYLWRRAYHDFQYVMPGLYLRWLRMSGSVEGLLKKLRQEGVTHVFLVEQRTRDVGRHYDWRDDELAVTTEFLSRHTVRIFKAPMAEIMEIVREPQPPRDLDGYGWMLFMHPENLVVWGKNAEAASLMRRTIERAPRLRGARTFLGMALVGMGLPDEGLRALAAGVAEGGEYASRAAYVTGQVKHFRGDKAGAELAWRKAIEIQPANDEARFNLGILLYGQGKKEDALRQLAAAAGLKPDNEDYARAVKGVARELGLE